MNYSMVVLSPASSLNRVKLQVTSGHITVRKGLCQPEHTFARLSGKDEVIQRKIIRKRMDIYIYIYGVPFMAQWLMNPIRIHEGCRFDAWLSGLRIPCCRELWCRLKTWLVSCIAVAVV